MQVLYHYTDAHGLQGIWTSGVLLPSTAKTSPSDVRYGNGQYLTDIDPGRMKLSRLSRALVGHPFKGHRFTHYLAVDVARLPLVYGRAGVYVILGDQPLDLTGRISAYGENHALP